MTLLLVECQPRLWNRLISLLPCGLAHCVLCVANTRWYCAALYSMLMLFVALGALWGSEQAAHVWEQHLPYLSVGKWFVFASAHLPQLLQLASSTSGAAIEVQQTGFNLGVYDHHCSSCHLPGRHVCTDGLHIGSAREEGRPDPLAGLPVPLNQGEKKTKSAESHCDEKPNMEVMQRLNHFSQRTTGEIMSSNYPRWRTDSEEVIIAANEGWNWAND